MEIPRSLVRTAATSSAAAAATSDYRKRGVSSREDAVTKNDNDRPARHVAAIVSDYPHRDHAGPGAPIIGVLELAWLRMQPIALGEDTA